MYVHGYRYNSAKIIHSYLHRLYCSVSSFLTPYRPPTDLDPHLRADWPAPHHLTDQLRIIDWPAPHHLLTFCFGVSLLTDQLPSSFSSGLVGFNGRSSLCGLRAKIDKGIFRHSDAVSKILRMIPPATHNSQRTTHTSIYIHIHINAHYRAITFMFHFFFISLAKSRYS